MAKRIGILIFSIAIIITGIIAFNRLHYWEQSVQIFRVDNEQTFKRGGDRHRRNFDDREYRNRFDGLGDRFERPDFRNLPDSVRQRIFAGRDSTASIDSLSEGRLRAFPAERGNLRNRSLERDGRNGRGDFRRGHNTQLGNVTWFLAVFALFTLVTIVIDKAYKLIRRKNNSQNNIYYKTEL
jgi:hypothetical protein